MCSEQEPHRVTATPQAHADQPRARRKYCRSGIDPFGEPGPRPLVLPADATHRNQQNLTWPAAYNELLLEYYVPLPRCPSGAWTSGWAGYCGCAHAAPTRPARCSDRNRWSERKTVTGRPQSRPSGSGRPRLGSAGAQLVRQLGSERARFMLPRTPRASASPGRDRTNLLSLVPLRGAGHDRGFPSQAARSR